MVEIGKDGKISESVILDKRQDDDNNATENKALLDSPFTFTANQTALISIQNCKIQKTILTIPHPELCNKLVKSFMDGKDINDIVESMHRSQSSGKYWISMILSCCTEIDSMQLVTLLITLTKSFDDCLLFHESLLLLLKMKSCEQIFSYYFDEERNVLGNDLLNSLFPVILWFLSILQYKRSLFYSLEKESINSLFELSFYRKVTSNMMLYSELYIKSLTVKTTSTFAELSSYWRQRLQILEKKNYSLLFKFLGNCLAFFEKSHPKSNLDEVAELIMFYKRDSLSTGSFFKEEQEIGTFIDYDFINISKCCKSSVKYDFLTQKRITRSFFQCCNCLHFMNGSKDEKSQEWQLFWDGVCLCGGKLIAINCQIIQ